MPPYNGKTEWDGEAGVWAASTDDVSGLAAGADTFEELIEKLKVVISRASRRKRIVGRRRR
jgi:predicted RNase H-like HicB family nuclease